MQDIIAGLVLAVGLMFPMIPLVDRLDYWLLTTSYAPVLILLVSVLLVKIYPKSIHWTPTRGDTTMCVAIYAGIQVGAWLNYQSGYIQVPELPPPYPVLWPSHAMMGHLLLRTVIGLCCVLATKAVGKSVCYALACAFVGKDQKEMKAAENSLANTNKIFVDLSSKFGMAFMIGLNIQYLLPNVFKLIGIGRPDFYTEI